LNFSYGNNGKPRLAAPAGERFMHFNVAHSDSLAVYAVSHAHEVGIDLERVRPICEAKEIAELFFLKTNSRNGFRFQPGGKRRNFSIAGRARRLR